MKRSEMVERIAEDFAQAFAEHIEKAFYDALQAEGASVE